MFRCNHQAEKYGYDVTFSGVGDPPPEREDVGHCSQTAVFKRKDQIEEEQQETGENEDHCYKLVNI